MNQQCEIPNDMSSCHNVHNSSSAHCSVGQGVVSQVQGPLDARVTHLLTTILVCMIFFWFSGFWFLFLWEISSSLLSAALLINSIWLAVRHYSSTRVHQFVFHGLEDFLIWFLVLLFFLSLFYISAMWFWGKTLFINIRTPYMRSRHRAPVIHDQLGW